MHTAVKTYHLSEIRVKGSTYSYIPIGQSRKKYTQDYYYYYYK